MNKAISAISKALSWLCGPFTKWQKVRLANVIVIVICLPVVLAGPSWVAMIDCVIIGVSLATIYLLGVVIKLRVSFDEMSAAFKAMSEINSQLINTRLNEIKSPPLEPTDVHRIH